MELRQKTQKKTHASMGTLVLTEEARIYNGAKTGYSINGAGKTGPATCRRTKSEYSLTPNTVHKNQLKMG